MFKNIFKAAKNLVKSPVGQLGISLLAPAIAPGISPALLAGGIGLLGGAKPQDVLRGVALGAGTAALTGGMTGRGGVGEFFMGQPQTTQVGSALIPKTQQGFADAINRELTSGVNLGAPDSISGGMQSLLSGVGEAVDKVGFLEKSGLIKTGEGLDFFEKYSPLLKLGSVGASIAAAALGEDQASMIYDPQQNPYLTGQVKITDVYTPAGFKQGGGINDFPEKDGMINGPGDGQSDDIPAMLSDGEFVMTKQAVMAAGNGDRDKGTKAMYSMMNNLEDKAQSMGIGRI